MSILDALFDIPPDAAADEEADIELLNPILLEVPPVCARRALRWAFRRGVKKAARLGVSRAVSLS